MYSTEPGKSEGGYAAPDRRAWPDQMQKKRFGQASLGFGCAGLSPHMSQTEPAALLEKALDCGISHFDTGRMYGAGAAEGILGQIAKRRRGEMTIVTKAGISPRSRLERAFGRLAGLVGGHNPSAFRFGEFSPEQIRRSVEKSLRELRVDSVDGLLLHDAEPDDITDELKRTLSDLKQQGIVASLGVATSVEHASTFASAHPELCEIIQIPTSPIEIALPANSTLIVHSVLGSRLSRFVALMGANDQLARRFSNEVGGNGADAETVARLFLLYEMSRNPGGVVLTSSMKLRHIELNGALLREKPDAEQTQAFARFLNTMEPQAS